MTAMNLVYKYLDSDRVGFLSDGLIRFTPPGALNDPYECLPSISKELDAIIMAEAKAHLFKLHEPLPTDERSTRRIKLKTAGKLWVQRQKKLLSKQDGFREKAMEEANGEINLELGILSLSQRWNSALMWSHYTKSYSGFCVGFHRDHDFFDEKNDYEEKNFPLTAVNYSTRRMQLNKIIFDTDDAKQLLLTKSVDWQYEMEERKVAALRNADHTIDALPFKISLFKIPFDAIAELIVGYRASPQVKQKIQDAAKRLNVPCYETRVSITSFDVERILLTALK